MENDKYAGKWELTGDNDNVVRISNSNGEKMQYKGKVIPSWDFENEKSTLVFTALDKNGISLWGKLIR